MNASEQEEPNPLNLAPDLSSNGPDPVDYFDEDALGRARRELVWTLGPVRMAGLLARAGFSRGRKEARGKKTVQETLAPLGQLSEKDGQKKKWTLTTASSKEADQFARFFGRKNKTPQCFYFSGFLSGFLSGVLEKSFFFIEQSCRAKGDLTCEFVGQEKDAWEESGEMGLSLYAEDNMAAELKEARRLLKLTRDRYQNMFEHSIVPIFIVDPETGAFVDANIATETLTGFPREDLLQKNMFDLFPPKEHHQTANHLKSVAAGEPQKGAEGTLLRKDGTHRIIHQSSKILSYGDRDVIQTVMRDITLFKDAEEKEKALHRQLLRSERLSGIGRLAAGVAHELKNPLGAIRNAVYYVKNALKGHDLLKADPHLEKILNLMETEIDGSVHIIGELLDFSRVVELVPRSTQVNQLVDMLPQAFKPPENIKINMDLDLTLPSALVDPDRLNQVFTNVFQNAIQAMRPEGGTLTIRTRLEILPRTEESDDPNEFISVTFEDTGKGIEPVHLKKIFEPLFTTKAQGTGLGLAISANIVEKHGGTIQATSKLGKGTTFTIKLPKNGPKEKE